VLGIGIDWAEEFHDIALGTLEKGVIEQFRIDHGPAGVAASIERALRLEREIVSQLGSPVKIGEHVGQFDSANGLQCYAGSAPVTRRSGKSDFAVARRLAHNHYLGTGVHQWAFRGLTRSGWAREFYDSKITAGKGHHAALRALSNRWLEFLWHCLIKGVLYDEAVHVANRNRALGHAA
jgi:hypothetical protein